MDNTRQQLNSLQEFNFNETAVLAGMMTTGEAIALKPVCENLGLNWPSQFKRIQRDEKLIKLLSYNKVIAKDNKSYEMACLKPYDFQNWLYSLNASENLNLPLWEEYKKGLVVYLLEMLRISLTEVVRLRAVEATHIILKVKVKKYFLTNSAGLDFNQQGKKMFKEAKDIQIEIMEDIDDTPHQGKLLLG